MNIFPLSVDEKRKAHKGGEVSSFEEIKKQPTKMYSELPEQKKSEKT